MIPQPRSDAQEAQTEWIYWERRKLSPVATYKEIQNHIRKTHGTVVQTCWIADVKEQLGLPKRIASNRQGMERVKPCPPAKRQMIVDAMRELGMIDKP